MLKVYEETSLARVNGAALRWWRLHVLKCTATQLASRLGYTEKTIWVYERGHYDNGKAISERALKRFKMRCAALVKCAPDKFDWGQ